MRWHGPNLNWKNIMNTNKEIWGGHILCREKGKKRWYRPAGWWTLKQLRELGFEAKFSRSKKCPYI